MQLYSNSKTYPNYPDSECAGDPFLCEIDAFDMPRLWYDRLGGFGIRVTLADDLRKPA